MLEWTVVFTPRATARPIAAARSRIAFKVTPISVATGVIPRIKSTTTITEN